MRRLQYTTPEKMDRAEADAALESGAPEVMCSVLVRLAVNEPDRSWVQARCLKLAEHENGNVRSTAALCLGHLARIHRTVDADAVMPVLKRLLDDPSASGNAQNALDDIETYTGVVLPR